MQLVAFFSTYLFRNVLEVLEFVDHILWTFVDKEARTCGHWHYYYTAIGDFLVIFNSSVNFVIYIVTNRNFRQGLMLTQTASSIMGTVSV